MSRYYEALRRLEREQRQAGTDDVAEAAAVRRDAPVQVGGVALELTGFAHVSEPKRSPAAARARGSGPG